MNFLKKILLSLPVLIFLTGCVPSKSDNYDASINHNRMISSSIQKHAVYPVGKTTAGGRVLLGIRLSRSGIVFDSFIVNSSGDKALDRAAIEAVALATPLPPVPEIVSGELFEYIIPITFPARENS